MKYLINIPDDLHFKFKVWCVKNKTNMKEEIIKLITQKLEEEEKETHES